MLFHLPYVLLGIPGTGDDVGEFSHFERPGAVGHTQKFGI